MLLKKFFKGNNYTFDTATKILQNTQLSDVRINFKDKIFFKRKRGSQAVENNNNKAL